GSRSAGDGVKDRNWVAFAGGAEGRALDHRLQTVHADTLGIHGVDMVNRRHEDGSALSVDDTAGPTIYHVRYGAHCYHRSRPLENVHQPGGVKRSVHGVLARFREGQAPLVDAYPDMM